MKRLVGIGMISLLALPLFASARESGREERVFGLRDRLADIGRRMSPDEKGVEMVSGEVMPYSLPRRIAEYDAERRLQAEELNVHAPQVNEFLSKIKAATLGKHDLTSYFLPTGVKPDADGLARVKAVVEKQRLLDLSDRLKDIVESSDSGELRLLCLEASKALDVATFNAERFLHSDAVVEESVKDLTVDLPAEKSRLEKELREALVLRRGGKI